MLQLQLIFVLKLALKLVDVLTTLSHHPPVFCYLWRWNRRLFIFVVDARGLLSCRRSSNSPFAAIAAINAVAICCFIPDDLRPDTRTSTIHTYQDTSVVRIVLLLCDTVPTYIYTRCVYAVDVEVD